MMMTGDCRGGRRVLQTMMRGKPGPELDAALDAQSTANCRNTAATVVGSPEQAALSKELAAMTGEAIDAERQDDVARCKAVGVRLDGFVAKHKIAAEPVLRHSAGAVSSIVTQCLAKNTDCAAARKTFEAQYRKIYVDLLSPDELDKGVDAMFDSSFPQCVGK
jgi:hypothetical protein